MRLPALRVDAAGLRSGPGVPAPPLPSPVFTVDFSKESPSKYDWSSAFANHEEEEAFEVTDIEGEIPTALCGTLFRNGPGRLERAGHKYSHIFDGDGMVHAFSIRGGRVHVRNAFVRTAEFEEEEAAGRVIHRNTFGTQPVGGWRKNAFNAMQKNVANTNVIWFGQRLLCLWEAAQPYKLEPATLRTVGLETLDGLLQPGMPFTTGVPALDRLASGLLGDPLSAHPKLDVPGEDEDEAEGPRLVTYGYRAKASPSAVVEGRGAFDSEITLYEFDEAWRVAARQEIAINGFAFVHDFVVTQHYALWFQNPTDFSPLPYVLGEKNPAELISFDASKPTVVHVVPRDPSSGRKRRRLELPACFVFHHARGFELGDEPGRETLVVDSVVLTAFPAFDTLTRPPDDADGEALRSLDFATTPINRLVRFEMDLGCADDAAAVSQTTPRPRACEFPCTGAVPPRQPHRFVFGACAAHASLNAPFQGVLRLDMSSGEEVCHFPGPRIFTNEPIFVPRQPKAQAEDDGWLLVLVFDAAERRSGLCVYDAARLDDGPLGVAWLRRGIPYGLHGSWVPDETFGWLEDAGKEA